MRNLKVSNKKNSEMKKRVNIEQVVGEVPSQLICLICRNLVHLPLDCTVCETSFCKQCICTWVEQNNTCPKRCENFDLKKSHSMVRNSLDSLMILCENSLLGCTVVIRLEDLEPHLKECPFLLRDCPNQSVGCEFRGTNSQLEEHYDLCPHHTLVCSHSCGASFKRINQPLHSCVAYLKQLSQDQEKAHKKEIQEIYKAMEETKKIFTKKVDHLQLNVSELSDQNIKNIVEIETLKKYHQLPSFQIFCKGDKTYTLEVQRDDTILALKKKIESKTGIEIESQKLVFQCKFLGNNESKLEDYNIEKACTIHLDTKPPLTRIEIHTNLTSSNKFTLIGTRSTTMKQIKDKICYHLNISPSLQELLHDGEPLSNLNKISVLSDSNSNHIGLTLKLKLISQ
jgi:hypothetical protein